MYCLYYNDRVLYCAVLWCAEPWILPTKNFHGYLVRSMEHGFIYVVGTRYAAAAYCTVLYCIVMYCTVLYCNVMYCTVLYITVICCTVIFYTVLYCTVPY